MSVGTWVKPGKVCTKCGVWQPLAGYSPNASARDGLKSQCKPCRAAASSVFYRAHREGILAREHERLPDTRAVKRAYDQQYRAAHREHLLAQQRARYAAVQRGRPQPLRSPEQQARGRERARAWTRANPEQAKANRRAGAQRDPARWTAYQQAHRARKRQNGGTVTGAEWRAIIEAQGGRCLCCGKHCQLTMDHIVPLARGGRHEAANLQGLCRGCNSRKHTRTIDYRTAGLGA